MVNEIMMPEVSDFVRPGSKTLGLVGQKRANLAEFLTIETFFR